MSNALLQRTYISGYHASEEWDDTDIKYYGSLGYNGAWVIEKWDTTGVPKTHRFARGTGDYWTNAVPNYASLVYVTFDEAFK